MSLIKLLTKITSLIITSCYILCSYAASPLFIVSATGTPAALDITLCLNGKGPLSCQNFNTGALNLNIRTVVPQKQYSYAGLRVNIPGYTLSGCTLIGNGFCLFSTSDSTPTSIALSPTTYELVTIGNPNNTNDPVTGRGGVNYIYKIGKYMVTINQYATFLNSVAKSDPYSLYDTQMMSDLNVAGISRQGSSGNYSYTVINNGGISSNRPIAYVTYFNAIRYANWMSNGQPMGAQVSSTTEDGAYALNGKTGGSSVVKNNINPNTGLVPSYYLPTDNEWYKAAYYSPSLNSGSGGYYLYATQSNETPGNLVGSGANLANWVDFGTIGFTVTKSLTWQVQSTNYLTDVGAFLNSASFYGTFDQSGNLGEMTNSDGSVFLACPRRGGFWFGGSTPMQSIIYAEGVLTKASSDTGFRLAAIA